MTVEKERYRRLVYRLLFYFLFEDINDPETVFNDLVAKRTSWRVFIPLWKCAHLEFQEFWGDGIKILLVDIKVLGKFLHFF